MIYLTTQQAADRLRICKKSFLKLGIPRVEIASRTFRYREEDLDAWARSRLEYGEVRGPSVSRGGKGGQRVVKIKQHGAPKVFSPDDLSKIAVRGGEG